VAKGREFSCLLTNDEEIRTLNKQFRKKDKTTDVLSFPALPESGDLGDIAISVDRAVAQAREHGHTVEQEIEILILHGLLHLLGYDHETDEGRMARAERRWRKSLGLPAGLIERVHA
jgi:probable rRNA maturation factor